jgi:DNA repair protein RecN (Recombination protein N)
MLAVRLVLTEADPATAEHGPSTLVFDEVDAGIGGSAALAVGQALAALAADGRQVLVVTHLPQVAACADAQIVVTKSDDGTVATTQVAAVSGDDRIIELSRMLSGSPDSAPTRDAAAHLLASARAARGGPS